eukprot:c21399_g1_i1 orf=98-1270(+)
MKPHLITTDLQGRACHRLCDSTPSVLLASPKQRNMILRSCVYPTTLPTISSQPVSLLPLHLRCRRRNISGDCCSLWTSFDTVFTRKVCRRNGKSLHLLRRRKVCRTFDLKIVALDLVDLNPLTFPSFLPPAVEHLKDRAARNMASRIQRLPVQISLMELPIMTSCVVASKNCSDSPPVVLLHGFDSSCLEWRYTYPLLEANNIECWAVDILGWGFSQSDGLSSFNVAAKREHLYEFWRQHVKEPMVLVGPSLGGAMALDFSLAYPDAVLKLVLVNAQGYAEGTGKMASFSKFLAYAGVGRLHCFMPGWSDATVDFMLSGGYNVASQIPNVQKETLVIWGKEDRILDNALPEKFNKDLPNSRVQYITNCGHLPHVEKPEVVAALINEVSRS